MDVSTPKYKALVLGASGMVGTELVKQLIKNPAYSQVIIAGRTQPEIQHPKLVFKKVNMHNVNSWKELFGVDHVFCCLGTTIKKAGSQKVFREVDHDMIINTALASEGLANTFVLISSLGANKNSSNFYLKTKGETEADVLGCNIPSIYILRPSMLFGNRKEKRLGERIGIVVMKMFQPLMLGGLRKFRGNHANNVAAAMILFAAESKPGKHIFDSWKFEEKLKN